MCLHYSLIRLVLSIPGDFLQDSEESEPTSLDRGASRHLLRLEHERAHTEQDWDALLERALERSGADSLAIYKTLNDKNPDEHDLQPLKMWRVAVKPGHEEEAAFRIFNKILWAGADRSTITSATGSASRPGWVSIESPSLAEVQAVCADMFNIFPTQIYAIDPEDARRWHREPRLYTPTPQSWIRLRQKPYHGDLAYVRDFDERLWEVSVFVVPRITYQELGQGKRPRSTQPPAALFDEHEARKRWGDDAVERRNQTCAFHQNLFEDGYLCLETKEFFAEEGVPTRTEILRFEACSVIPREFLEKSLQVAAMRCVKLGDRVKVISGELKGALGVIQGMANGEADIELEDVRICATIPLDALSKDLRIGDDVAVISGPHVGLRGWIVWVEAEMLKIYVSKLAKEFDLMSHQVLWSERAHGAEGGRVGVERRTRFAADPLKKYLGRNVLVVNKGTRWKGYQGILKSSLEGDKVQVELHATMKREAIPLKNIKFIMAPKPGVQGVSLSDLPSSATTLPAYLMNSTPVNAPVVPATPLAGPSHTVSSPAWDPSSRTPNLRSNFPYNPWMDHDLLQGKRIKVIFADTKARGTDLGWRNGEYENRQALWVGTSGSDAVLLEGMTRIVVPERYVRPAGPTVKGQHVVAIKEGLISGQEWYILEFKEDYCTVRRREDRGQSKRIRRELETSSLAVIA
ncbi:hypothetical protein H0H81_001444 [Sphagnurus paluster]|uniref:Chromatin elongation factor SPT5 n=1 Tax=Sphagnurus paluster TaxID=117069 RepID=A0A9P7FPI7_9AGAR|nr:hypothetical protein H0H81_001444 [Sphagnurus paluster]